MTVAKLTEDLSLGNRTQHDNRIPQVCGLHELLDSPDIARFGFAFSCDTEPRSRQLINHLPKGPNQIENTFAADDTSGKENCLPLRRFLQAEEIAVDGICNVVDPNARFEKSREIVRHVPIDCDEMLCFLQVPTLHHNGDQALAKTEIDRLLVLAVLPLYTVDRENGRPAG